MPGSSIPNARDTRRSRSRSRSRSAPAWVYAATGIPQRASRTSSPSRSTSTSTSYIYPDDDDLSSGWRTHRRVTLSFDEDTVREPLRPAASSFPDILPARVPRYYARAPGYMPCQQRPYEPFVHHYNSFEGPPGPVVHVPPPPPVMHPGHAFAMHVPPMPAFHLPQMPSAPLSQVFGAGESVFETVTEDTSASSSRSDNTVQDLNVPWAHTASVSPANAPPTNAIPASMPPSLASMNPSFAGMTPAQAHAQGRDQYKLWAPSRHRRAFPAMSRDPAQGPVGWERQAVPQPPLGRDRRAEGGL